MYPEAGACLRQLRVRLNRDFTQDDIQLLNILYHQKLIDKSYIPKYKKLGVKIDRLKAVSFGKNQLLIIITNYKYLLDVEQDYESCQI